MRNVHTRSRVGRDGLLKLEIPTELSETDIDVVVVYQPIETASAKPTPEEPGWPPHFFEETAGQWQGEPLTREPQGEYEVREELK
jgi:hypothetical protein